METYTYTCDVCGLECEAPAHPRGKRKRICPSCLPEHRRQWERDYFTSEAGREKARRAREKYNGTPAARSAYYRYAYGITADQYVAMFNAQHGVCAACGEPETARYSGGRARHPESSRGSRPETRRLAVDHDHQTGEVRGLLCHHCNAALGHLRDDPERVRALLTYIEHF